MNVCRPLLCLLALCLSAAATTHAQTSDTAGPTPRLHGAVRSTTRAVLPGSALPRALSPRDLGPVPAAYPLHGITLVLRRSPAQQAALDQLLADQQNPTSPQYHHWLTPDTFAARFGADESDLLAVEQWLTAQGFTLVSRSHARDRITFSGTAAEVAIAFGTPLHRIQVNGEPHIAPLHDLTLPTDLASITTAVLHLSDLRPHPQLHPTPKPAYTSASGAHFLAPYDLRVMYNVPSANANGPLPALAIVGESYLSPDAFAVDQFQIEYTQPDAVTPVLVPGSGVEALFPGPLAEAELDLEYASAFVPTAQLFYVYVGSDPHYSVFDALAFAIDQNIAPVVSISYGECEAFISPAYAAQATSLFQQANAQGQTIIAAAGDAGSTACAYYNSASGLSVAQQQDLAVDYPASNPYVVAVGGTQMAAANFAPNSTFWSATPSSTADTAPTLLSYVPELAWNEGSPTNDLLASGGGASALFSRPDWQTSLPGIPAGSTRLVPDIAFQASIASPGFVFCTTDPDYGNTDTSAPCLYPSGTLITGGGTSFAAPFFAGVVTLLNQTRNENGQGNLNPMLYALAANATPTTSPFHDITMGSTACVPGARHCFAQGQSGFSAGIGFDQATGLGSMDITSFFGQLPAPPAGPALDPTFVQFTPSITSGSPGGLARELVNVFSVVPSGTTIPAPTGTATLSIDGVVVQQGIPLNASGPDSSSAIVAVSVSVPSAAPSGSHLATLAYSGDSLHAPSTGTQVILVGNTLATGNVTLAVSNLTLPTNGSGTTPVAITPTGGYNGRLFWSLAVTGSSNGAGITACYSIPDVAVNGATSVNVALGVGTACSSDLPNARGRLRTLHAGKPTPPSPWHPAAATTVAASLLVLSLVPIARRRRPASLLALLLVLSVLPIALTGCGGGSNNSGGGGGGSSPTPPTPQATTFTLTLTGQDSVNSSIQSTATFTLTTP